MNERGYREPGEVPTRWRERYRAGVGATAFNLLGALLQLPFGAGLLAGTLVGGAGMLPQVVAQRGAWEIAKSLGTIAVLLSFGVVLGSVLTWYGFAMLADGLGARRKLTGPIERLAVRRGKGLSYSIVVQGVSVTVPESVYLGLKEGDRVRLECGRFERELTALWAET